MKARASSSVIQLLGGVGTGGGDGLGMITGIGVAATTATEATGVADGNGVDGGTAVAVGAGVAAGVWAMTGTGVAMANDSAGFSGGFPRCKNRYQPTFNRTSTTNPPAPMKIIL